MECNNEAKLKEQSCSRITESKKGPAVTKGDKWFRVGCEGGGRGFRGIMIDTHGVGGWSQGTQCSTEKTSSDSVASYYADGQRFQWVLGGT